MSLNKNLEKYWKKLESDPEFVAEGILIDILENILEIMEKKNISKADLAKKLGTSKAYVTRLFHGTPNMTILTLAKLAVALEVDIEAPKFIWNKPDFEKWSTKLNLFVSEKEDKTKIEECSYDCSHAA